MARVPSAAVAVNKRDAIDARKLAERLQAGLLSAVYHGETSALEVQQLERSYTTLTEDTTRVIGRLKAVFRCQAIAWTGRKLYGHHRAEYLAELGACALRRRAEHLYQQLDALQALRHQARHDLIIKCRNHAAAKWLETVPFLRPLRAAVRPVTRHFRSES